MSWNRSSGAAKPEPKKPSAMRGVIAGGVIVLAACAAFFFLFSGGDDAPKAKHEKDRGLIKEVKPSRAAKYEGAREEPQAPVKHKIWENDPRVDENGIVVRPPWKMTPVVVTNGMHHVKSIEQIAFTESSDRLVACLLLATPGDSIVGEDDGTMFSGFTELFLKSLKTPIEDSPDDTDSVRDLKQAVREMRVELKKHYDAGEDLDKLMSESRKELRELGLYRDELQREVDRVLADGKEFSAADLKDLEGAANKMLEERGVKPIEIPEFLFRRAELMAKQKQRENGGAEAAETEAGAED